MPAGIAGGTIRVAVISIPPVCLVSTKLFEFGAVSHRAGRGAACDIWPYLSSQIELIADRHPAMAARGLLHHAQRRERHVEAGDEQLVGRRHVEHALARGDRLVLVV